MTNSAEHRLTADDLIRDGLGVRRVGRRIHVFDELPSTNTRALDEFRSPSDDGSVILAEHQTAGRGRVGRSWHSPRGASLLMTATLIDAPEKQVSPTRAILSSALALLEAILETTDVEPTLRWPNDLYVGPRKLAGILIETRQTPEPGFRAMAIGIGLNCLQHQAHFPPEFQGRATSLEIESTAPVDRIVIARALIRRLDAHFPRDGRPADEALVAAWRTHSADLGVHVRVTESGTIYVGRILDIDPHEGLLLQLDSGGRRHFNPATTSRL